MKLVVRSGLLVLLASGLPLAASIERLDPRVEPRAQSIRLEIDPDTTSYRGSTVITLRLEAEIPGFALHARDLEIESLRLTGSAGALETEHRVADDRLEIDCDPTCTSGDYELEISFHRPFESRAVSLYRTELAGEGYAFTQFEAADARGAFPCFDEPGFKIPFSVTVRAPVSDLVVGNAPVAEERVADGWREVELAPTPPLPTYLVALAVGPFDVVPIPGLSVPGRILTVAGQGRLAANAAAVAAPLLDALERYFGRPYPFAKLDFLAVPEFWPGGMENAGAITYADRILLVDPERATPQAQRRLVDVISHELAHQWFGDLVTLAWWDDLWLNESFADWMGIKIADRLYPELGIALYQLQDSEESLARDARRSTPPIRRPIVSASHLLQDVGLVYDKGRRVLAMVEHWLGEDRFQTGIRLYLDRHAWGSATSSDLWSALSEAADTDVAAVLAGFVDQPGYPLLSVEPLGEGRYRVRQQRYLPAGTQADAQSWRIPLDLRLGGEEGSRVASHLMTRAEETLELGPATWIYPNAEVSGVYRWSLPTAELSRLAHDADTLLSTRERIGLVSNLDALLAAGELGGGPYLDLLAALGDDPAPEVVSAVLGALEGVVDAFVTPELEAPFAAYVRRMLAPAVERWGLEARAGEPQPVALLRPELWRWLADEGQEAAVRARGRELAERLLAGESVDPTLAATVLSIAALSGDGDLFTRLVTHFESATEPDIRGLYLGALGSFRSPALQRRALAFLLEGSVRANEMRRVTEGIRSTPAGRDLVFDWTTAHYDTITARLPAEFAAFLPGLASGCSADRLAKAQAFFADAARTDPGIGVSLARVEEQVGQCRSLREREGSSVAASLEPVEEP